MVEHGLSSRSSSCQQAPSLEEMFFTFANSMIAQFFEVVVLELAFLSKEYHMII
jgi:hypothetical protein